MNSGQETSFLAKVKAFFLPRPDDREEHMRVDEYMFLDNSIRLLDDEGQPIEDGNKYFKAMADFAQVIHRTAHLIGNEGTDQIIGWLNKWRGPDAVIYERPHHIEVKDVRLPVEQIDFLIDYCRSRESVLEAGLKKRDDYHAGVERHRLINLRQRLERHESEEHKKTLFGRVISVEDCSEISTARQW